MKRERLTIPQNYVTALERTLGIQLSSDALRTRVGKKALEQYAESVQKLSIGLTKDRTVLLATSYLSDADLRKAYLLYFQTTNALKVIPPLREFFLGSELLKKDTLRILDLGCGTGAASWGALHFLRDEMKYEGKIELVLSDNVGENLHLAKTFLYALDAKQAMTTKFLHSDLRKPNALSAEITSGAPYDLILAMNIVNELPQGNDALFLESMLLMLDEQGALVVIEPATKSQSRRLLEFRDLTTKNGATIFSPCTRQANCPALINPNDWCHTEIDWDRPHFIKMIDEITGNLRLSLKSSYFVITKNGATLASRLENRKFSRVVSELFIEKGRRRMYLCNTDGRDEFTMNLRDKNDKNRDVVELERYDLIEVVGEEAREHDRRITEASTVEIVLRSSGAR